MATSGVLAFGNIKGPESPDSGAFKVSNELFGWKNKRTGEIIQHRHKDIQDVTCIKTGAGRYQLRIELNESKNFLPLRFDGFNDKAIEEIKQHFTKYFNLPVKSDQVSSTGWHWGNYEFHNNCFKLRIDNKCGIEIDSKAISQATIPSKNDFAIEFKHEDSSTKDELVEIRFCVPHKQESEDAELQLEDLKQTFLLKAGLDELKTETIALVMDIPLIVPRGRYEIEFTKRNIKLHGKSYDYTMLFTNVVRMFLVPKPNSPHINFVLGLNQPMIQGQTRYPYVVMQFDTEEEGSVDVNLDEKELDRLKLTKSLEGKLYNIITRLFGALIDRAIVVPGDFKSEKGESGFSCTFKATSGHLFPLNKCFLFIVKPVIYIRFEDIVSVEFSRTGMVSQNRLFSFIVLVRSGQEYEFTNIDRGEFKHLSEYLDLRQIKTKNAEDTAKTKTDYMDDDDMDEDEDFEEEEEEEEEEEDDDDEEEEEDEL